VGLLVRDGADDDAERDAMPGSELAPQVTSTEVTASITLPMPKRRFSSATA
jgi:hypothetical protein